MRPIDADELMRKMGVESLKYDNANIKHGFYKSMVLVADAPVVEPQQDNRLERIADIVEGTIDHLDLDDAMDMLYQIKEVLK